MAIATRFTAQVRGLNVAMRNAGDGISLAQTAEGALGAMTDSLQRLRELALQSANATNSDTDRQALNAEARQLIDEISRISDQTNFNGRKIFDGNFSSSVQIGTNVGETVSFGVAKVSASTLGGGIGAGVSARGTSSALANGDLTINGVSVGPSSAVDDTASTANKAASAIAKYRGRGAGECKRPGGHFDDGGRVERHCDAQRSRDQRCNRWCQRGLRSSVSRTGDQREIAANRRHGDRFGS
ncbi:MAG: hypothetical protein NT024_10405 [Proteobacteria bacterium]|nr:hypothetical protein [Pseudomonadota bacterium]